MGATYSSNLPNDAIQSILEKTPTTTIFDSALYVNSRWNEIGRRNVIWLPRFKLLTGVELDPLDYKEYEVFPLFMRTYFSYPHVWTDSTGNVTSFDENLKLAEFSMDYEDDDVVIRDGKILPVPGVYWIDKPDVQLLTTHFNRDPRLFIIRRRRGQTAQIEESANLQIHSSPNDLLGIRILGKGTYNCALLMDEGYVLRIANLDNATNWTLKAIPRGAAIVHLLNQYKHILGPCVVEEKYAGFTRKTLPKQVKDFVCKNLKKSDGPFYFHGIEHLTGKEFDKDDRGNEEANAFFLIWFFYVARSHFRLKHGDLKPDNIMFRKLDEPQFFTFKLGDKLYDFGPITTVPVVIDFDFSSVFVTERPKNKFGYDKDFRTGNAMGTPPEILVQKVLEQTAGYIAPMIESDDWWALGMSFYDRWVGWSLPKEVRPYRDRYVKAVWKNLTKKNNVEEYWVENGLRSLFTACMIQAFIEHSLVPENGDERFYGGEAYTILREASDVYDEQFENVKPYPKAVMRKLLSWDPKRRHIGKNPSKIITSFFPTAKNLPRAPQYVYMPEENREIRPEVWDVMNKTDALKATFISKGSLNCAVLLDDGTVMRVSEETDPKIARGAAIIHLLNEHPRELGPSLLVEKTPGYTHCGQIPECNMRGQGPYYVHGIEYLSGGEFDTKHATDDEEFIAFSLIWFFFTARVMFNFKHGDLKMNNLMFRTLDGPRTISFLLDSNSYTFEKITHVPVVIDFDFASVDVTENKTEWGNSDGGVPPEFLIEYVQSTTSDVDVQLPEYDDWWGLGMVLFYRWSDWSMDRYLQEQQEEYAYVVWKDSFEDEDPRIRGAIDGVFEACMIQKLIGENPIVPPENLNNEFFTGEALVYIIENAKLLEPLKTLSDFQRRLLGRLLSWDPVARSYGNRPWLYFEQGHFKPGLMHPEDYAFNTRNAGRLAPIPDNVKELRSLISDEIIN